MTDRELILEAVQQMPEAASTAEILNELALLKTVQERLAKVRRGEAKLVPHEEIASRLAQWTSQ